MKTNVTPLFFIQCKLLSFFSYPFLPYSLCIFLIPRMTGVCFLLQYKEDTWCTRAGGSTLLVLANTRGKLTKVQDLLTGGERRISCMNKACEGGTVPDTVVYFVFFLSQRESYTCMLYCPSKVPSHEEVQCSTKIGRDRTSTSQGSAWCLAQCSRESLSFLFLQLCRVHAIGVLKAQLF